MNRRSGLLRQAAPVKHDLARRRTLKHKSVLMRQYGVYLLTASYIGFGAYCLNKYISPPEYQSEEEQEKSQNKFGLSDLVTRGQGYIRAWRETSVNQTELSEVRLPKK